MRSFTIWLLVACLLGGAAGSAAAQSPSPDSMAAKRIEVPAAGVAVTYPESWAVTVAPWDLYQPDTGFAGLHHIMAHDAARPQTCGSCTPSGRWTRRHPSRSAMRPRPLGWRSSRTRIRSY